MEVHCEASDVPKNGTRRERKKREIGGSTDSTPLEYHENSGVAKRDDGLIFMSPAELHNA
ncbi:hypothetical protein E5D57_006697 [Metarhizium anisopliae]|nr:hypothetical protein E5D57_006697 [Metarhizium anisopliae]